MNNTVRHAVRDYLSTIDAPDEEYVGETITQVNIRANELMVAAIDALAQRMKLSRSATAKFILESALYDALAEVGLQMGYEPDEQGNMVVRAMTNQEQLDAIARGLEQRDA